MASAATLIRNQVILDFGSHQLPLLLKESFNPNIVSLMFKGPQVAIDLHISERSFSDTLRKPTTEQGLKPIEITIEQISNLTLRSVFLRESPVQPVRPENLEVGQNYCLQIISTENSLKARLIDEEVQLLSYQKELFQLLGDVLDKSMKSLFLKFKKRLIFLHLIDKPIIKTIFKTFDIKALTTEAINNEIKKIDKVTLKNLLKKIRVSLSEWESKQPIEQAAIAKENFKCCFEVIGHKNLIGMMCSALSIIAHDFQTKTGNTRSTECLLNKIVTKFVDNLLKSVSA